MYRLLLCVFSLFLIPTQAPAAEEVINERIEWSDVWIVNADSDTLPRVLLVGDSIVKGYYNGLEKALEGKANWDILILRSCAFAQRLEGWTPTTASAAMLRDAPRRGDCPARRRRSSA